jgi:hypothetical protein
VCHPHPCGGDPAERIRRVTRGAGIQSSPEASKVASVLLASGSTVRSPLHLRCLGPWSRAWLSEYCVRGFLSTLAVTVTWSPSVDPINKSIPEGDMCCRSSEQLDATRTIERTPRRVLLELNGKQTRSSILSGSILPPLRVLGFGSLGGRSLRVNCGAFHFACGIVDHAGRRH